MLELKLVMLSAKESNLSEIDLIDWIVLTSVRKKHWVVLIIEWVTKWIQISIGTRLFNFIMTTLGYLMFLHSDIIKRAGGKKI